MNRPFSFTPWITQKLNNISGFPMAINTYMVRQSMPGANGRKQTFIGALGPKSLTVYLVSDPNMCQPT